MTIRPIPIIVALGVTSAAHAQTTTIDLVRPLLALAIVVVVVLAIWRLAPGWLSWLGRLPGDLRLKRNSFTLYLPIVSALLVSLLLSLFIGTIGWLLGLVATLVGWLGNLPGDIRIERGNFTLFLPITSMLLLSLLLSVILSAVAWLLRRGKRG
ncbi:MAG: DUF2905 domain-containing protein [Truepera sp.]|nr:DUF2905 domain-containing protein [Truepera sp.]